jgi:hypothetical protein
VTNFARTLPAERSELAQQLVKDPYSFDFLSLGPDMLERDLERGLLEHLRSLILELGKGFAFVGSQHPLEVGGQDYYLDLLFYHLRLRCFVVIELKIEEFKPEFAGKMNFYLSAVDDLLRHPADEPSIGIILCKNQNEVVVEYALRDTTKLMGMAQYRLSPSLPAQLREDLPTVEDFAREFPLMSVVELRIEIERALRSLLALQGCLEAGRTPGIRQALHELAHHGELPSGTEAFLEALNVMNQAAHGLDVDPAAAERSVRIGTTFLAELRRLTGIGSEPVIDRLQTVRTGISPRYQPIAPDRRSWNRRGGRQYCPPPVPRTPRNGPARPGTASTAAGNRSPAGQPIPSPSAISSAFMSQT